MKVDLPKSVLIILLISIGLMSFVGTVTAMRTLRYYVLPYIPAGSVTISPTIPEHLVISSKLFAKQSPFVDKPIRLHIDSIKINAPIIEVGVTPNNSIDVPDKPMKVGWFNGSALPGEWGSAILTAHYDTPTGQPALFHQLGNLESGDYVTVQSESHILTRFRVREVMSVEVDTFPVEMLYHQENKEVLWLITCDGVWNPKSRSYTHRLIVRAEVAK